MNQTTKRRAIALLNTRSEEAMREAEKNNAACEVPKAIQAKVDKIAALATEIRDAGFDLSNYGKWSVSFKNDHPDLVARRERIAAAKDVIKQRRERIELDIWAGRIEDFAEVEAQADALVGGE